MMLNIGDKAPDFSMPITVDNFIKLSDFVGKFVVLYFYPKDNTPGCSIEASSFNSLKSEFDKCGAVIIGISKDDLDSHANFKQQLCLSFDLASDNDSDTCEKYGVFVEKSMFGKKYKGINRSTFLVDRDGNIAYIWKKVEVLAHAKHVLEKIQEIKVASCVR